MELGESSTTTAAKRTDAPRSRRSSGASTQQGRSDRLSGLWSTWHSWVPGVVALAVVLVLAFDQGGYFPSSYLGGGAAAMIALAAILLARVPTLQLSTQALVALGGLFAFTAWTGLSWEWSSTPDSALAALQRDVLYVALFGLGLFAAGSGRYTWMLVCGVLVVVTVVVGAGLLSRVAPDLVHGTYSPVAPDRLSWPLGYWNAFGALAALGTVLATGISGSVKSAVWLRAVAAGIAVMCGIAMYLSLSRGAWLATIAGVLVLLLIGTHRISLIWTLALVGAGSALAVVRLRSYPALQHPALPHGGAQGRDYLAQLVLLFAGVIFVQFVVAAGRTSPGLIDLGNRARRPVLIGLATVLVIVVPLGYLVKSRFIEGHTENALRSASHWTHRQWQDFLRPATFSDQGTARLTTSRGTRSELYRTAWAGFKAHPLQGDGAGTFPIRWTRTRRVDEQVRNAHSLEIETLGELGIIGAFALVLFLGAVIAAAVRSRARPGGLGRSESAAVAAGTSVWLVHSAVDWDWQMPALTGIALVLAASLFPYGRRRVKRRSAGSVRAGEHLETTY